MNPLPVHTESATLKPLDRDLIRALWSKTYNSGGKPDWSHIYPYYHPQVEFRDSIQGIKGIKAFIALCERLTKRSQKLRMDIHEVAQEGRTFFIQWTMTMVFRNSPSTPIYGSTALTLHEDGRIIRQRDYYDLWGDIYDAIPGWRRIYRLFMRRVFG